MNESQSNSTNQDATRSVGRGGIYLTFTKLYFILSSYVIYFGLPRIGGLSVFGGYKAVNATTSLLSTVLNVGTLQAVSRFVGREPAQARVVRNRALRLQVVLGLVVAAGYFLLAPIIQDDPELLLAMRVAAGIPLVYAVYAVLLGTLNGQRRFGEQALVDAGFTTAKMVAVLAGVALLGTVAGAFWGFLGAAVLVLLAGAWLTQRGLRGVQASPDQAPQAEELFRFQMQTVGFMALVQWVVQMDIWYVEWFGAYDAAALKEARGIYGSAQLFSQIAYSLVISVTFVLFPLISALDLRERSDEARRYVREALRFALIMVVGVAAVLSSTPRATIGLLLDLTELNVLGLDQLDALRWLGPGYVFFALTFIVCSILNAAGSPRSSILVMLVMAAIQLGLGGWFMQEWQLPGLGLAGLCAMAAGCLLALRILRERIGPVVPWATVLRCLLAAGVVYAIALIWSPHGAVLTLLRLAVEGLLFLVLVVVLGEFKAADRERFRSVLRFRSRS